MSPGEIYRLLLSPNDYFEYRVHLDELKELFKRNTFSPLVHSHLSC
jgi:hypothetical protein